MAYFEISTKCIFISFIIIGRFTILIKANTDLFWLWIFITKKNESIYKQENEKQSTDRYYFYLKTKVLTQEIFPHFSHKFPHLLYAAVDYTLHVDMELDT